MLLRVSARHTVASLGRIAVETAIRYRETAIIFDRTADIRQFRSVFKGNGIDGHTCGWINLDYACRGIARDSEPAGQRGAVYRE